MMKVSAPRAADFQFDRVEDKAPAPEPPKWRTRRSGERAPEGAIRHCLERQAMCAEKIPCQGLQGPFKERTLEPLRGRDP
jgi:hypothetical protein